MELNISCEKPRTEEEKAVKLRKQGKAADLNSVVSQLKPLTLILVIRLNYYSNYLAKSATLKEYQKNGEKIIQAAAKERRPAELLQL